MEEETKKKLARIAMMLCAAAGVLSLVIFIPQVREMVIGIVERLRGQMIEYEVGHRKLIAMEIEFLLLVSTAV